MGNSVKSRVKDSEPGENEQEDERRPEDHQLRKKIEQVKNKLIKANKGKTKNGPNELQDLAEKLVDNKKTKGEFFGHLLEYTRNARLVVSEEHHAFERGFPNEQTREDCEQRMAEPFEQIKKLEVKLILHELKDSHLVRQVATFVDKYVSNFTFGPFHAAILIGDVVLEWRPNSLVIPHKIKKIHSKDHKAVLFTNVHEKPFDGQLPTIPLQYEGADREAVASSFEMIKDITREKETLIDELVNVVVMFNTKQSYGLFTNNCQHFVLNVLEVLGITNPEEVFRGKLKQHANLVMARSKKEATPEFNSHEELDRHIKEQNIDKMSHDDLEFAYCHYLLFHAWGERFPYEDDWRCHPSDCQVNNIAKKLNL